MSFPVPAERMRPLEHIPLVTVVSGPTAVGKGTVVARLRQRYPDLFVSVSVTTRPPRPGEIDGVSYYFVDDAEFDQLISSDGLLEWATVHNSARYGTPRRPVEDAVAIGQRVVLEIDLQGARQIKQHLAEAQYVFLVPPSWEELEHRLIGRGTETPEQQQRRLETAKTELAAAGEFDQVVVNGRIEETVDKLVGLLGL